jgi:hypothetical protein
MADPLGMAFQYLMTAKARAPGTSWEFTCNISSLRCNKQTSPGFSGLEEVTVSFLRVGFKTNPLVSGLKPTAHARVDSGRTIKMANRAARATLGIILVLSL